MTYLEHHSSNLTGLRFSVSQSNSKDSSDRSFDTAVAEVLASEAAKRIDDLHLNVEHLRATIRFQNERMRKMKKQEGGSDGIRRLQLELEKAKKAAILLEARRKSAARRLLAARELSKTKFAGKILSVQREPIEVAHSQTKLFIRIYRSILDTGNENVCILSMAVAKKLGLGEAARGSSRSISILGVIPGKVETWPLVQISMKVKGRIFNVDAAVGGTTPLLISNPDVIVPLMRDHGYVIGAN